MFVPVILQTPFESNSTANPSPNFDISSLLTLDTIQLQYYLLHHQLSQTFSAL